MPVASSLDRLFRAPSERPTFGILSTFPPTQCGLATFSAALADGLASSGAQARVVRIGDGSPSADPRIVGELVNGSTASTSAAAELLNTCDVAVVQHEYGAYGGPDGDELLDVLGSLSIPVIVIAHTVLSEPTPRQRAVLLAVAGFADRVVVMSGVARHRLTKDFHIDPAKVEIIAHGAAVPAAGASSRPKRPTLLTWGLVGPGKGIERVIDAMPKLQALQPRPRYLVAGRTHPKVLAAQGEAYRNACIEQAWRNGTAGSVDFEPAYRDVRALTSLIQSAAAVVLPYDSKDQATSGVLVDALAAGRPVIATAFPHAIELLSGGAGILVDHDDPDALQLALYRTLTEPGLAHEMAAEAARIAPGLGWPVVAKAYLDLARTIVAERPAFV